MRMNGDIPAAISANGSQQPDRLAHAPGEMRHCAVHADDQIQVLNDRSSFFKIVQIIAQVQDWQAISHRVELLCCGAYLHTDKRALRANNNGAKG